MNLISVFQGITTPANELYAQIAGQGWQPTKVSWDKGSGQFVAEAQNLHGEKLQKTGPDEKTALGNLLGAVARHNHIRTAAQWKLGMWKTMFADQLEPIAKAYAQAPVYDPKAAANFKELADDSMRRYQVLAKQLHIEVVDDPEPYASAQEMANDIHEKQHFFVSRANSEHPVWTVEQNVAFRTVHDVLGHAVSGGDFGWQGENLACAAHFPLLTPTAQQALFTECIAQTAYAAYYRSFGPQKVALFPQFTEGPQTQENDPGHRGVHPSQSVAPVSMPTVQPSPPGDQVGQPQGAIAPHMEGLGLTPVMSPTFAKRYASLFADPNYGWSSGEQPMQLETHGVGNAYLDHSDPLESDAVMDNAALIDTGWSNLKKGGGGPDVQRMKQAIVNAFRVVLLSPRKDLKWNAIHYQDISHVPADTDDPKAYWDTLEARRRSWNQAQGIDPDAHMVYYRYLKPFESVIYQMHPELGFKGAQKKAKDILFAWWTEEQQRIEADDAEKPADKQRPSDEIERRANEALAKRLQVFLKDKTSVKTDVPANTPEQLRLGTLNQNYVDEKAKEIKKALKPDELPDEHADELMRLYALLALSKGKATTMEDVHDAWSTWTAEIKPRHKSLVPFDELEKKIQDYDQPYMQAIRKCASSGNLEQLVHESIDYGELWVNDQEKKVFWIMGDADPPELIDDVRDAARAAYPGYELDGDAEAAAPKGPSWKRVAAKEDARAKPQKCTECKNPAIKSLVWAEGMAYVPVCAKHEQSMRVHLKKEDGEGAFQEIMIKEAADGQYNLLTGKEGLKYGAFMGTHLKAISQISRRADELLDAALKDVEEHDGAGHHFRTAVLSLGISGVGPKVASFAWLLLQPLTSQLATIDTHMMDVLGHHYEKDMNNRDYFKFERQLAAGRDASGYSHIPLGAFQWGMWDHKRTGPGSHQDHSAMRVLDPVPHQHIDWASKAQNLKGESWLDQAPDWWRNTQAARDAAAQEWENNIAPNFPQSGIPYQVLNDRKAASVLKTGGESEDEFHVAFALPQRVVLRCSEIAQELSLQEEDPENYHITAFWSEVGYSDHDLHNWIQRSSMSGFRFENARIEYFPTQSDRTADKQFAVVLRFDAPEAKKHMEDLIDEAEDRGLEIKRFPGGWKGHITLGWSKTKGEEGQKFPDLSFRAGDLYVSVPRPLRKTADSDFAKGFAYWWDKEKPHHEWDAKKMAEYARGTKTSRKDAKKFLEAHKDDVRGDFEEFKSKFFDKFDNLRASSGVVKVGTMQRLREQYPGLSTPDIWKLEQGEEGVVSDADSQGQGDQSSEPARSEEALAV